MLSYLKANKIKGIKWNKSNVQPWNVWYFETFLIFVWILLILECQSVPCTTKAASIEVWVIKRISISRQKLMAELIIFHLTSWFVRILEHKINQFISLFLFQWLLLECWKLCWFPKTMEQSLVVCSLLWYLFTFTGHCQVVLVLLGIPKTPT